MRVLVVGGGGREHAMCRALATGPEPPEILAAPGNPGIAALARLLPVAADDVDGLVAAARSESVDLVLPGPELPLVLGLADALGAAGIACCGPTAAAARLEGSKAFTREVCAAAGVPSPAHRIVDRAGDVDAALAAFDRVPVVKADGLAAGKGVFLPDTVEGCRDAALRLLDGALGPAGARVVVEERLAGTEASLFFVVDGVDAVRLPHARDYKRLLDGDRGPNTGGMGSVSPNPDIGEGEVAAVEADIVLPILAHLAASGNPYRGFLYAGLMLTDEGPRLLEINVRLGDPEAQVILPRLEPGAFGEIAAGAAAGAVGGPGPVVDAAPTCAVVVASHGYPDAPRRGDPITIGPSTEGEDRWIDYAGTSLRDGRLVTAGGRVAAVVARAATVPEARAAAYRGVAGLHWEGMQYRTDIGRDRA